MDYFTRYYVCVILMWSGSLSNSATIPKTNHTASTSNQNETDVINSTSATSEPTSGGLFSAGNVPHYIPLYTDQEEIVNDSERVGVNSVGGERGGKGDHGPVSAPRYMMELYNEQKNGGKTRPYNTVRSIQPITGYRRKSDHFAFPLSSVHTLEHLIKAEIHIYKKIPKRERKKTGHRSQRTMTMVIYDFLNQTTKANDLQYVPLSPRTSGGWQIYDITRSVEVTLEETPEREMPYVGANFLWSRPDDNSKRPPMKMNSFRRHYSSLALVIFSKTSQNITLDHLNPYFKSGARAKGGDIIDPETGEPIKTSVNTPRVKSRDRQNGKIVDLEWGDFNAGKVKGRQRRSIYDNEIPQHPDEYMIPPPLSSHAFNAVLPKLSILKTKSSLNKHRKYKNLKLKDRKYKKSRLIPYPEEYKRQNRNKNRGSSTRRKSSDSSNRKKPVEDNVYLEDRNRNGNQVMAGTGCQRRRLRVNFVDISWYDVVAPESFDAHYCAGACSLNDTLDPNTTNHAKIQSLVNHVGVQPNVPTPCCSPKEYGSVPVLYIDPSDTVVLKLFPQMTVKSCACR